MKRKQFVRYSDEQRQQARDTDIIEFLGRYEGFTFKKTGRGYKCVEHNSLVINENRKMWYWNSENKHGVTVVDYLQEIHAMSYPESMDIIIGKEKASIPVAPKVIKNEQQEQKFILPEKTTDKYSRIFAYLINARGLDKDIVTQCIKDKILYQDKNGNAVFVGYDEESQSKFACMRGTLSQIQFRGDCTGSDKKYPFKIEGTEKDRLYVFESPIDALSYMTLSKKHTNTEVYKKFNYISLAGTSDVALESYLESNKNVTSIIFCLDNDTAGNLACENYLLKYHQKGYQTMRKAPKSPAKDFNEQLIQSFLQKQKEGDTVIYVRTNSITK